MVIFCFKGFLKVMTLACLISRAGGIKCYSCRSDVHTDCLSKNLNKSYLIDCPKRSEYSGDGYCRKISQQLYFRNETTITEIRECAYERSESPCYLSKWTENSFQRTCECSEDGCNRSSSRLPSILTIVMLIVLHILWQQW